MTPEGGGTWACLYALRKEKRRRKGPMNRGQGTTSPRQTVAPGACARMEVGCRATTQSTKHKAQTLRRTFAVTHGDFYTVIFFHALHKALTPSVDTKDASQTLHTYSGNNTPRPLGSNVVGTKTPPTLYLLMYLPHTKRAEFPRQQRQAGWVAIEGLAPRLSQTAAGGASRPKKQTKNQTKEGAIERSLRPAGAG